MFVFLKISHSLYDHILVTNDETLPIFIKKSTQERERERNKMQGPKFK
jgi:hypothetical protein